MCVLFFFGGIAVEAGVRDGSGRGGGTYLETKAKMRLLLGAPVSRAF